MTGLGILRLTSGQDLFTGGLLLFSVKQQAGCGPLCPPRGPDADGAASWWLAFLFCPSFPLSHSFILSFPLSLPSFLFTLSFVFSKSLLWSSKLSTSFIQETSRQAKTQKESRHPSVFGIQGNCSGVVMEVEGEENNFGCRAENFGEARLIRGWFPLACTLLGWNSSGVGVGALLERTGRFLAVVCSAHLLISLTPWVPMSVSALPCF